MVERLKIEGDGGADKDTDIFAGLDALAQDAISEAGSKTQILGSVLPTADPKALKPDKPRSSRRGHGDFKENELGALKKKGDEYLSTVENEITQAENVENLMSLVDSVSSKGARTKLSLKLPNGLPRLLLLDTEFSQKFNVLIDKWEKRIVEVLFDDARIKNFRISLREALKIMPEAVDRGVFLSKYLEDIHFSILGDVVPVREKLVALWKEYYPSIQRKLKRKKIKKNNKGLGGNVNTMAQPVVGPLSLSPDSAQPGDHQEPLPDSNVSKSKGKEGKLPRKGLSAQPIDVDDAVRNANNKGNEEERKAFEKSVRRYAQDAGILPSNSPRVAVDIVDAEPYIEIASFLKDIPAWEQKVAIIHDALQKMMDKISNLENISEEAKEEGLKTWLGKQVEQYLPSKVSGGTEALIAFFWKHNEINKDRNI